MNDLSTTSPKPAAASAFSAVTARICPPDAAGVKAAVEALREGKLIGLPTETVYGLAGDATQDHAVAAIYAAKNRPHFNPLIIHAAAREGFANQAEFDDRAEILAQSFWPGPLTLVLPRRKQSTISLLASAGLETLALRVPAHPAAQAVLAAFGRPVAAPSANRSGRLSPTTPTHVQEELGGTLALILAGGKASVGLESTVLDLTEKTPTVLRPGAVTAEMLARTLDAEVTVASALKEGESPKSPGLLLRHYAPNHPLRLNATSPLENEAFLAFGPALSATKAKVTLNLSETGDLNEAAANLFAMLRKLDAEDVTAIAVMPIPNTGLGLAINDRLQRAAHG